MYLAGISQQLRLFMLSLGLGFLLGTVYDLLRMLRLILSKKPGKYTLFVQDIIYVVFCAVTTFLFLLSENYGEIRAYVPIGEIIGFFVYYFTVGILTMRAADSVANAIHKFLRGLKNIILRPFRAVHLFILKHKSASKEKVPEKAKKVSKNFKLHLQHDGNVLYNLKGIIFSKRNKRKK